MKRFRFGNAPLVAAAILASLPAACAKNGAAPALPPANTFSDSAATQRPATGVTFKVFTAGSTQGFLSSAQAWDVTPGANGTVWFTDVHTPAIGRIDSAGNVQEYTGLPAQARPYSLVVDAHGTPWFTDAGTASLGRVNSDGTISEFTDAKLSGSQPQDLTIAPDRSIWFIAVGPTSYLTHATQQGALTVTQLSSRFSPDGSLIADKSGNLWYLTIGANFKAVLQQRMRDGTTLHHMTKLAAGVEPCCPNLAPKRMTIGPDGNLWFTTLDYVLGSSAANWIATMTPSGLIYDRVRNGTIDYAVYPSGIATSGSSMWFTGDDPFQANGGLWQLHADGTMRAYPVPFNPAGMTVDANGAVWFTSATGGHPSQIVQAVVK